MKQSTGLIFIKVILFLLLSPILYFWYLLLWPLAYFFTRFRSSTEFTAQLQNNDNEWLNIIVIILLWIFCSFIIAFLFLFYSLAQYLRVYQTLPNALRGLFGLAWIILFFQKVLKIKS
ncbi:hypothetical protein [Spiroplasma melliferum]|uniref:Transmembrane protein n=1 Tax=Spiroplasma melliferum KC3 TaxID=570509 RepID=A0AAI9T3V8_SPIME|nr:hypothetical protein [Spiroplasma melliferum]ELL44972.1 hypothetical protein SMIPMB4A_v3c1080 [Spiroplasma melliferum IPMB4A]KAI92610.1 hypothetical protein SPM_000615 [Spiroplasma melliferum KC3]